MASYGYTFNSGDGVTPTRLNAARTVSNIVNADIDNAAAIDKTKISGTAITAADTGTVTSAMIADGAIVNADINASAAIAHSKLANITSGQVLLGNASNVPTATAVTGDVTINNTGVTAIGAGVIVDADVNASAAIALSKLATGALPTAITVASANIVDGTIVDADVNASAAIALSKLATGALPTAITVASANIVDGTIVNADINASAAIAGTKIVSDFGSQNISTTGNLNVGKVTTSGHVATENFGTLGVNLVYDSNDARWEYVGNGHGYALAQTSDNLNIYHAGNNTNGGNTVASPAVRVTLDTTGNVGIGTSSPIVKLDVAGLIRSFIATIVDGAAATWRLLAFKTNNVSRWDMGATVDNETGSNAGSDFFLHRFSDAGAFLERVLHISRATGNVGIGTASPSTKLDVNGTVTATAFSGPLTGTASAIADGTVSTAKIVDGAVTDNKIASGVDASKLTAGTLPIARIADAAVTPAKLSQPYTLATAKNSTSGTSIDFTGIPSWARRITVMFDGVSISGANNILIQLGDSGGFESSGYLGAAGSVNFTNGFGVASANAANIWHGSITITSMGSNRWVASGCYGNSAAATTQAVGGSKTLSDTLTQVRITASNGTDTFDAGTINISYE